MSLVKNTQLFTRVNNETLGITTEFAFCKIYNITNNINTNRVNNSLLQKLEEKIEEFKKEYPFLKINEHLGCNNGSIDFKCEDGKTVSIKTNKTKSGPKMCPQNIGQPSRKTFIKFNNLDSNLDDDQLKQFIINNTDNLVKKYYDNLFCCDYLIWLYRGINNVFDLRILKKEKYPLIENKFSFSRYVKEDDIINTKSKKKWAEGSTLYYDGRSIGEFQFHKKRDNVKFRFYIKKLLEYN